LLHSSSWLSLLLFTSIILFSSAYAQTVTLGEPYFVEKGRITGQKEIGPNKTQYTFTANGTMNGNIEVTDTGEFVSVSKGEPAPGLTTTKDGVITTKDGSETANYTGIDVGNGTDYQGASAFSTNSTGKLAFLNNILVIYKIDGDESGIMRVHNGSGSSSGSGSMIIHWCCRII
jgi:hypothetical protein